LALVAFCGWYFTGADWQQALLIAVAVLIITCPCALALAVPVVHVVASGRLMQRGILIKSGTALERIANTTTAVFDKTGTLTVGGAKIIEETSLPADALRSAAGLAVNSRHPLARAVVMAAEERGLPVQAAQSVTETPGGGLSRTVPDGVERLGNRRFCGLTDESTETAQELWLCRPNEQPVRFAFADPLRDDAGAVIAQLQNEGLKVNILSGDRPAAVEAVAHTLGVDAWEGGLRPDDKLSRLQQLSDAGECTLMVGDGLNDAPALAGAHVSMSPSTAVDISQTAADVVFQGTRLEPVVETRRIALRAHSLIRQNIGLALAYNVVTIPLAIAGFVTPIIAAAAMSASSVCVIVNALRLKRG
jgi:Cu2+-exporting ATPase